MLRMISLLGCLVLLIIGLVASPVLAINKVLYLDGDGDYVEIVDSPILNNLNQITIEAWVRADNYSGWMSILFKGDETAPEGKNRSFTLWLYESGTIHFISAPTDSSQVDFYSPVGSIHLNTWYHIAGVIDTENRILKLFINGNEVASTSYGDSIRKTVLPLKIGLGDCCATFSGYIDEVRVFSLARTQAQIQETMNRPLISDEIQDENLVGYWNFDNGDARDLSQYENHGELYGNAQIADIIYVSTEGDDLTGDGTFEHPYRTIQKGINESRRNDIVQALPGTYEENISLFSDLIVLGSGAENTTITSDSGSIVTANNAYNVNLSGFTLDGKRNADNGILCSGTTSGVEISRNVITGASVGIRCIDSVNVDIKDNTVSQNINHGVECSGSTDVTIDDNDIKDNQKYGIACNGNSKVNIMNNDIRRNSEGLYCWDMAHANTQNNVISENYGIGVHCTNSTVVTYISNTIQYNEHGFWCSGVSDVNITDNLIHNNQDCGIYTKGSSNTKIIRNIIRGRHGAIDCHDVVNTIIGGNLTDANNITSDNGIAIYNSASTTINATYNYWGTTDEDEIAAMMINEGEGSIIFKPFINTLSEMNTHQIKLSLTKGINILSLPLKPDTTYTARTFAEKLGATFVIEYDKDISGFSVFLPTVATTDGFPIRGGMGYIVNLTQDIEIEFTGTAWTGALLAPQLNDTWAFVVGGKVFNTDIVKVEAINLRTRMKAESFTGIFGQNTYTIGFVDMSRREVVSAGDELEIVA